MNRKDEKSMFYDALTELTRDSKPSVFFSIHRIFGAAFNRIAKQLKAEGISVGGRRYGDAYTHVDQYINVRDRLPAKDHQTIAGYMRELELEGRAQRIETDTTTSPESIVTGSQYRTIQTFYRAVLNK
jgi:hypothetical protein